MSRAILPDIRFWLVAAAFAATLAALFVPRITMQRDVYDMLAVIDLTSSMNTRDLTSDGKPVSRLDAAKDALRATLAAMPCQSRLGLGIFTERRSFVLFDPVEVCGNFAAIDDSIAALDWRMGWDGGSYIAKGLYSAIEIAQSLKTDLMFFTDGHEAPPLPFSGLPPFEGKRGEVGGLIVGVGGSSRSPLAKYDNEGRETGTFGARDLPQENREGPPPPDAASRPGYHPKWAPFGNAVVDNGEHLAFLREPHLKELSGVTGLDYARLDPGESLLPALAAAAKPRRLETQADISRYPASFALVLLIALFGFVPLAAIARGARPFARKFATVRMESVR
jgi:mxaL protein